MSTFLSDLQSEAWGLGVKLIADTSTEIDVDVDPACLAGALTSFLQKLIAASGAGTCVSLVSELEAPAARPGRDCLKIQISAPRVASERLEQATCDLRSALAQAGVTVEASHTEAATTVDMLVPHARARMTLASGRTAVVVDDDVDTQEFLSEVLKSRGFRVISVSDGFDALVAIERHQPDVVLTDILMPNMSGIDLVSRIKSVRADLPVVVFSGYCDTLVRSSAGLPDKILPKPMSRGDVLQALEAVLSK